MELVHVDTFLSVKVGRHVPGGFMLGGIGCPIALDKVPPRVWEWANRHGLGKADTLIYVIPEAVVPQPGIPFAHAVHLNVDLDTDLDEVHAIPIRARGILIP